MGRREIEQVIGSGIVLKPSNQIKYSYVMIFGSKIMLNLRLINICFLLFILFSGRLVYGSGNDQTIIKVGLAIEQDQLLMNLDNSITVLDLVDSQPQTLQIPGEQFIITATGNIININYLPVSSGPLVIFPGTKHLTWSFHNYRGAFLVTAKNGKLNLLNQLHLEDYLRGVVPKEVPADWPMAALKAQAITARTYTIASLNRHIGKGFNICALDHCQVYGGVDAERVSTDQAVSNTAGEVITYRGKVISALYHSASGGNTADASEVWSSAVPYLKPVIDWDQNSPYSKWTKSLSWIELQGFSIRSYPQLGRLRLIIPLDYSKEGKLQKVILKGDLGEATITGEQFRFLLGLPSSKVKIGVVYGPEPFITLWWINNNQYPEAIMANNEIPGLTADLLDPPWDLPDPWSWLQDKEPRQIICKGSGWGHGVGLSQWGAKGMADSGFDERQILTHFYPGVTISNLPNK